MSLKVLSFLAATATASYIPPYYEGTPTSASVVSLDPPDYRGEESYRYCIAPEITVVYL